MATDAYGRRQQRKQRKGQGCVVVLIVGASLLAGLGYIASNVVGWLV